MDNRKAVEAWRARRASRLDEYQRGENWVTIRGVHVLLDKNGNVINDFKDPKHKLKNLRFVDAVSSHSEGGKKIIDAPLQRKTHEEKFNESIDKITSAFGASSISKEDVQKRMANALANLEQGAIIKTDNLSALKLGKGLYKVKGEKSNLTAKQLAEKIMGGVSVSELSGNVSGMPKVKTGTNTNVIQKGSKRISHVAKNALEELYNKYKSNKYSYTGLKELSTDYLYSLPKGAELTIGGNKFSKENDDYWTIESDGESHNVSLNLMSSMLLNSMSTGYAGGTINAKLPEASESEESKVEETAEKISDTKPEKEPESFPSEEEIEKMEEEYEKESSSKTSKPISESMSEIAKGEGSSSEKANKMLEFLKGLPDGTPLTYEAVNKYTGELYTVKGTKQGDKIKFFSKEAPLHSIASSFVKKLEKGLMVGGSDESIFPKTSESKPEDTSTSEAKPAEEKKAEETSTMSTPPTKTFPTERLQKTSGVSYDTSKFTPEKKEEAQNAWKSKDYHVYKRFSVSPKEWYSALSANVQKMFYDYTGAGYTGINSALRNVGTDGMSSYDKERVNQMTEALAQSKLTEPTCLRRGVSVYTLAGMLGMSELDLDLAIKKGTKHLQDMFVDGIAVENGFASCGSTPTTGFLHKRVDMEIYCPEGTEAVFANTFSPHSSTKKSGEYETLLQRGSAFRITDISVEPGVYGNIKVKCEVVAQRLLLDSFGDDVSGKLAA